MFDFRFYVTYVYASGFNVSIMHSVVSSKNQNCFRSSVVASGVYKKNICFERKNAQAHGFLEVHTMS